MGFLRKAEDGDTGGGGHDEGSSDGLVSGLESFIDSNPDVTATATSKEKAEPKVDDADDDGGIGFLSGDSAPPTRGEEEKKADESEKEDDDLGLPELGSAPKAEERKEDEFDEAAFDAQTNKEIEGLDPSKGDAWKALKEEIKQYKKGEITSTQLQTQLEELKAKNAELEESAAKEKAMEEKVSSITKRNAELLLEENPEYQDKVAVPHDEISKTVKALSEAKSVSQAEIWSAIRENDPVKRMNMIDALESKIGGRHALTVQQMADDIRVVARIDQEMRASAVEIVEKARQEELASREEGSKHSVASFQASAKDAFSRYADKVPGFVDDTKNMTDAAKAAQARALTVDIENLNSGDLGYMVFSTQAFPAALREIKRLQSENRDLRVASGGGRNIALGSSSKKEPESSHVNKETGEPLTFMERFERAEFSAG